MKLKIIGLLLVLVLLYGCTNSAVKAPDQTAKSPDKPAETKMDNTAKTVNVEIKGFAFNPSSLTVPKGTTVVWTQSDDMPHTVTGDGFDSGTLSKGQTFSHVFDKEGTFEYHCSIHPSMKGEVTVSGST